MNDDFFKMVNNTNDEHKKKEAEFNRLAAEIPIKVDIGDKVIVATGLIGRGYNWVRKECEVIAIAGSSVKIKGKDSFSVDDKHWEEWIDAVLIVDKIK